jgi:hypothetical protein
MFKKTKVALSAAIVLSTAFPASAATTHYRITRVDPGLYDSDPGNGDCSPVHPPLCSNICAGPGPCAPIDGY